MHAMFHWRISMATIGIVVQKTLITISCAERFPSLRSCESCSLFVFVHSYILKLSQDYSAAPMSLHHIVNTRNNLLQRQHPLRMLHSLVSSQSQMWDIRGLPARISAGWSSFFHDDDYRDASYQLYYSLTTARLSIRLRSTSVE